VLSLLAHAYLAPEHHKWWFRAGRLETPSQGLPPLPFPFCSGASSAGLDSSAPINQQGYRQQAVQIGRSGPSLAHQNRAASTASSWKTCCNPPSEHFSYPTTAVTTRAKSTSSTENAWMERLEQLEAAVSSYLQICHLPTNIGYSPKFSTKCFLNQMMYTLVMTPMTRTPSNVLHL
jgi:hypothetical protein